MPSKKPSRADSSIRKSINENETQPGSLENSENENENKHLEALEKRKATAKFSGKAGAQRQQPRPKPVVQVRAQTAVTHYEEFKHPNQASMDGGQLPPP